MKNFTLKIKVLAVALLILFGVGSSAQTRQQVLTAPVQQSNTSAERLTQDGILPGFFPYNGVSPLKKLNKKSVRLNADGTQIEQVIICDEDFALWTRGTEDEPDNESLTGNWWIDNSLTHQPGWSGRTATMAGGACGLAWTGSGYTGGTLNTPMGDYSGHVKITFRAKLTRGTTQGYLILALLHDMSIPAVVSGGIDEDISFTGTDWQEFSYECDCVYGGDDAYFQFNTYSNVIIDDIKVIIDNSTIASPILYPATDYTVDGFTANWGEVKAATNYLLTVYSEDPTSTDEYVECTLPEHLFTTDNDTIETEYNGGLITKLYLTYDIVSENSNPSDDEWIGFFEFQGWDGYRWSTLFYVYHNAWHKEADFSNYVAGKYYKVRIISAEIEGLHQIKYNVSYTTTTPTERNYVMENASVQGTSYVLSGLDPEKDYFYYVRAENTNTGVISDMPNSCISAFGISTPVVTEATEVSAEDAAYTANWQPTPKAARYLVENYEVYTAPEAEQGHMSIDEHFTNVILSGYNEGNPYYLDNSNLMSLNGITDYMGWYVYLGALIDGAIGAMGNPVFGIGGEVQTPELSTQHNDGVYNVKMTVKGHAGDYLTVINRARVGGYIELNGEWQTLEFSLTNGQDHDYIAFASYLHYDFFIKEFQVTQDLSAGNQVMTLIAEGQTEGRNSTSYRFENLDEKDNVTYAYDVFAYHTFYSKTCVSQRSDLVYVDVFDKQYEDEALAALAGTYTVDAYLTEDYGYTPVELTFTLTYNENNGTLALTQVTGDEHDFTDLNIPATIVDGVLHLTPYTSADYSTYLYNVDDNYSTSDALVEILDNGDLRFMTNYYAIYLDFTTYVNTQYVIYPDAIAKRDDGHSSSVTVVKVDEAADGPMYDLMGRRIINPQPGQIYIQNGKKYIAK